MDQPQRRIRRNPDERRAQILDQALRLIGEQGYRGFTINALAVGCGLSNAGLLHYFGSKDALLLGVLQEIGQRDAILITPLARTASDAPSPAKLREVLIAFAASATSKPEMSRFTIMMMSESIAPDHPAHTWFRDREIELRRLMTRLSTGWAADPEAVALQMQSLLYGFLLQWLHGACPFDLSTEWTKAIDALLPAHDKNTLTKKASS